MTTKLVGALTALAAASMLVFAAPSAKAQDMPTAEQTYKDIEKTFGFVPTFMKLYPEQGIAGAWAMTSHSPLDLRNHIRQPLNAGSRVAACGVTMFSVNGS